jgi:outer membrane protein OmpA-like peptidoglycan-associated protein
MKQIIFLFFLFCFQFSFAQKSIYKSFSDTGLKKGDNLLAPTILFYDARFDETAHDSLAKIAAFLQKHSDLEVEIGCFTDFRGSDLHNKKASIAKANMVVQYLIEKFQIPLKQISPYGYGETNLVYSEETCMKEKDLNKREAMMAKNRRIELKILGKLE